jgi:hypothetical protein
MKKGEGIKAQTFHYWMGEESIHGSTMELIKSCQVGAEYFVPWDVLTTLAEKYDVQMFHRTIELGNHKISGLVIVLDSPGGRHRQR